MQLPRSGLSFDLPLGNYELVKTFINCMFHRTMVEKRVDKKLFLL